MAGWHLHRDQALKRGRLAVTLGDPRGIGPEITAAALARARSGAAGGGEQGFETVIVGPAMPEPLERKLVALGDRELIGEWHDPTAGTGANTTEPDPAEAAAGRLSALSVERAVDLALSGQADGVVTAPLSKNAISAAGWNFPGHTELMQHRTRSDEAVMIMAAEETPLGGPLRMALLTTHIPLRAVADTVTEELIVCKTLVTAEALRRWWGVERPRILFAGMNPHCGEGGMFGTEEHEVFEPALAKLSGRDDLTVAGLLPGDTVYLAALRGDADLVITPYHDSGLAVLKTVARDTGVNVTAGLPFPRTSPDHGTAFDIAGTGTANPGAMTAAVELCLRFVRSETRP
ncbi:MAG: 4-hydroxythreonine-4-phosphate dehydrogenase PdxA [Gemmatimonadetes bacterium]|nr:4-hydroxythreonine-4-phosphate dehydrogenase PdxA [Gemmatimonadota bacterium]